MATSYEFSDKIYNIQDISWSRDDRIAFCTGGFVKILKITGIPTKTDTSLQCHQNSIPVDSKIVKISQYTDYDLKTLLRDLPREQQQELIVDKVLNPIWYPANELPLTAYCMTDWSPAGLDPVGRCILATLSQDHRLCLYTQGVDQFDWSKLCDLTLKHQSLLTCDINRQSVKQFHKYRDWCYSQAVTAISWCPTTYADNETGSQYSILAAGTMSGHVILWRCAMPCTQESDISLLATVQPTQSQCTCIGWSKQSGILVVGHQDGQVYSVHGTSSPGCESRVICLHKEPDLLRVSCLGVVQCHKTGKDVVIVSKEHCIFAYNIDGSGNYSYVRGDNALGGSGMCYAGDNTIVMTSLDGLVQTVHVDLNTEDSSISLTVDKCNPRLPSDMSWNIYGIASSSTQLFAVFVVRPYTGYDHLEKKWKLPTKIHFKTLDEGGLNIIKKDDQTWLNMLQNDKYPFIELSLALELYRIYCIKHEADHSSITGSTFRHLQLKRYFTIVRITHCEEKANAKPSPLRAKEEELKWRPIVNGLNKQLQMLQTVLLSMYIQSCVTRIATAGYSADKEKDLVVLYRMYKFLKVRGEEMADKTDTSVIEKTDDMSQIVDDVREQNARTRDTLNDRLGASIQDTKCCICQDIMTISDMLWKCGNGHVFDICCKTVQACEGVDYRTCTVCLAHALSIEQLTEYPWLPGNNHQCTLCGSLML